MPKPVRKAVFPVAGLGTRFLPATKALPKEMLPIVDKPLIQYAVEEAQEAGIEEFIFVTGRAKSAIEDHFDHSIELETVLRERGKVESLHSVLDWMPPPGHISYTRQQEPLGLGHAVWCARNFVSDEPFAVLLADDLILAQPGCLKQMIDAYRRVGGNIVAVDTVPRDMTDQYGIIDVAKEDGTWWRQGGGREAGAGGGALHAGDHRPVHPGADRLDDSRAPGARARQRNSAYRRDGQDHRLIPFHGYRFDGRRFDCGSKVGYLEANLAYRWSGRT